MTSKKLRQLEARCLKISGELYDGGLNQLGAQMDKMSLLLFQEARAVEKGEEYRKKKKVK